MTKINDEDQINSILDMIRNRPKDQPDPQEQERMVEIGKNLLECMRQLSYELRVCEEPSHLYDYLTRVHRALILFEREHNIDIDANDLFV